MLALVLLVIAPDRLTKKSGEIFGWVRFLISLGSPHVRPVGRTCRRAGEVELAPIEAELNGSRSADAAAIAPVARTEGLGHGHGHNYGCCVSPHSACAAERRVASRSVA